MIPRLILIAALALAVTACGVKNDLIMPNGKETAKNKTDPSKPPHSVGQ